MTAFDEHRVENPLRSEAGQAEEAVLVEKIIAGNTDDFEIIIDRYQAKLINLIRRHLHQEDELDDALQEIFLRVYSSLPRFGGRSNLYTWIYSIASNYLIDRLRKRRHRRISHNELLESGIELPAEGPGAGSPASAFEISEETKLIWLAMEDMDALFKNILILREVEDLDYEELSDILHIGVGTVKSRLYRARADLKRRYEALDLAGKREPDRI